MTRTRTHHETARRNRPARERRGFTLLEIIVVVIIIALLASLVAPRLLSRVGMAKQNVAKAETASIAQQVKLWMVDNGHGRLPDDFELDQLADGNDPYLERRGLSDPWERPYTLVNPGEEHIDFDVVSYGADGEPGGEGEDADVVQP